MRKLVMVMALAVVTVPLFESLTLCKESHRLAAFPRTASGGQQPVAAVPLFQ
jgi:hypothetical protein